MPALRALTCTRVPVSLLESVKHALVPPAVVWLMSVAVGVDPNTRATQTPSVEMPAVVPLPAVRSVDDARHDRR